MSNDTPTTGSNDRTEPEASSTTPDATSDAAAPQSTTDAEPPRAFTPEAPATPAEPEPLREPEPAPAPAASESAAESAWAPSSEPTTDTRPEQANTADASTDTPPAAASASDAHNADDHASTSDTPTSAAPAAAEAPAAATAPTTDAASELTPATTPAPTVVYVDPPARPKKRGTRGVGIAVVLLATGIFTVLYALATIILALALRPDGLNGFVEYLASAPFLVPVAVFAGAHLLLVLIANRAGWWMHVLGGFLVAVLVWVAFLGAAIIAAGALGAPAGQQQALLLQQVVNPLGILATVLAREIPIWVGGIVARRGRTQAAKNAEAQEAYERDLAAHRASVAPQAPTR